jgi:hypothetical protein
MGHPIQGGATIGKDWELPARLFRKVADTA